MVAAGNFDDDDDKEEEKKVYLTFDSFWDNWQL